MSAMRSWSYSYKTSDGLRHEAEMSAPTKDDVYAALREKGIRAIRVTERIAPIVRRGFRGLRKREWVIGSCVLAVVVCGAVVCTRLTVVRNASAKEDATAEPSPPVYHPAYKALETKVADVMAEYRASGGRIDVELLTNYALVEQGANARVLDCELEKGRQLVAKTKERIRSIYQSDYQWIPESESASLSAAQILYGVAIGEVEDFENELEGDALALKLLKQHQGEWRTVRGVVEWNDKDLAREFEFYRRLGTNVPSPSEKDYGKKRRHRRANFFSDPH